MGNIILIKRGRKSQVVLELLFLTGMALISVGSVISLLIGFGVLDFNNFLPDSCILTPGLACEDFNVNQDSIKIIVKNGLNKNIDLKISIDACEVSSKNSVVEYGKTEIFALSGCINEDRLFKEDLKLEYFFGSNSLTHNAVGSIRAREDSCVGLFSASCGGLIIDGATMFLCNFDTADFLCDAGGLPTINVNGTLVEGRHGEGGAYIEEGINLVPNSGFENGLDDFFLVGQSENAPVVDIVGAYQGQSVHFESVNNSGNGSTIVTDIGDAFPVTPGESITLTHYVKKLNVIKGLTENSTAYNFNRWLSDSSTVCSTCGLDPVVIFGEGTEDWTRYETTFVVPDDAKYFWYNWSGIGDTGQGELWLDNIQLEKRGSSTLYAGEGPDQLTFDKTGSNANGLNGTIEFWVKPFWEPGDGLRHEFFTVILSDGAIRFFKDVDTKVKFVLEETTSGDEYVVESDISNWVEGEWTHLAATWISDLGNGENQMELFIDGSLVDNEASRPEAIGFQMKAPAYLYVGTNENFQYYSYAVLDDLRVSNVLRQ